MSTKWRKYRKMPVLTISDKRTTSKYMFACTFSVVLTLIPHYIIMVKGPFMQCGNTVYQLTFSTEPQLAADNHGI